MKNLLVMVLGLIFGFGLAVSGMTDPARVQGFLDLAGRWDPTLAFVMGGGLLVNLPAYWLTRRRTRPFLERQFHLPTRKGVDLRLLFGAAAFGIGWAVAGFCPGPALASLSSGQPVVAGFCLAMLAGMFLADKAVQAATWKRLPEQGGKS
jgi:uncharacterized membrane protein YedE/YeeE